MRFSTDRVPEHCSNCIEQREAEVVIEAFIPLNGWMSEFSGLESYEPEVVKPYLTREISWRAVKVCFRASL